MRDEFTSRVASLAAVVAALATLGAVIYLSVRGEQVNEYLAGLAGLTIGALLPSPLTAQSGSTPQRDQSAAGRSTPAAAPVEPSTGRVVGA